MKSQLPLRSFFTYDHRPSHYDDVLAAYNDSFHARIAEQLQGYFPELSDQACAIAFTGSDGRKEKSPRSLVELVVLHEGSEKQKKIEEIVNDYVRNNPEYDPTVEIKDISQDLCIAYQGNSQIIFPTRVLDATYLVGNPYIFQEYKKSLFTELEGSKGKILLKKFESRRRESRFELTRKNSRRSFGEDGILYFDDDRVKATKYSHLRPVQYKLAADIFKSIRNENLDEKSIRDLPRRTINRLGHLFSENRLRLGSQELSDVCEAYSMSLYWFHCAEERFVYQGESMTQVDAQELQEVSRIIERFSGFQGNIINDA